MASLFPPADIPLGNPDWGFNESPSADVNEIKLGDGYVSREPKGINYLKDTLDLTWSSLDPAVATAAYRLVKPMLKLKPMIFIHPITGEYLQLVPQACTITYDEYNNAILSITVETDYNPV